MWADSFNWFAPANLPLVARRRKEKSNGKYFISHISLLVQRRRGRFFRKRKTGRAQRWATKKAPPKEVKTGKKVAHLANNTLLRSLLLVTVPQARFVALLSFFLSGSAFLPNIVSLSFCLQTALVNRTACPLQLRLFPISFILQLFLVSLSGCPSSCLETHSLFSFFSYPVCHTGIVHGVHTGKERPTLGVEFALHSLPGFASTVGGDPTAVRRDDVRLMLWVRQHNIIINQY
jgi:hypothetical protein